MGEPRELKPAPKLAAVEGGSAEPVDPIERPDFTHLSFDELKGAAAEVKRLSETSFRQTSFGFETVAGDKVIIVLGLGEQWHLSQITSGTREMEKMAEYYTVVGHLTSNTREELVDQIIAILEKRGFRVIE